MTLLRFTLQCIWIFPIIRSDSRKYTNAKQPFTAWKCFEICNLALWNCLISRLLLAKLRTASKGLICGALLARRFPMKEKENFLSVAKITLFRHKKFINSNWATFSEIRKCFAIRRPVNFRTTERAKFYQMQLKDSCVHLWTSDTSSRTQLRWSINDSTSRTSFRWSQ